MLRGYGLVILLILVLFFTCERDQRPAASIAEVAQLQDCVAEASVDSVAWCLPRLLEVQASIDLPDSLQARTNYVQGLYFFEQGGLDTAARFFHQAIALSEPPITEQKADYFRMAWRAYRAQGEFGECLAISDRLAELLEDSNDPQRLALVYFIRQNAYRQQRDFEKAMENNQRYIEQLELARDTQGLASAYISKLFYTYFILRDPEATFQILDDLVAKEEQYSTNVNRLVLGDYGVYLFYEGRYRESLSYYLRGLEKAKQLENDPGINSFLGNAYSNIAEVHLELGDYAQAQLYLDSVSMVGLQSLPENVRNNSLRYQLRLAYEDKRGLGQIMGALDTILWYQDQQFIQKNESELDALRLANAKEKELLASNQEEALKNLRLQSRLLLLLVVLGITVLIAYLLYRQRKLRFEKQELQLHQRLLRTQMNPHFTFNTLYAIQRLIKKDPTKAAQYQLKFSRLLRLILENSTANYVQLDKELEAVEQYLELQLLRFPNKFAYRFKLEGVRRDDLVFIPPMLLQPMVENSIEHGFAGIDYLGQIEISLRRHDTKYLFCTIEDNGLGILDTIGKAKPTKSSELIDAFLRKITTGGISVENKDQGSSGVVVQFMIPYQSSTND